MNALRNFLRRLFGRQPRQAKPVEYLPASALPGDQAELIRLAIIEPWRTEYGTGEPWFKCDAEGLTWFRDHLQGQDVAPVPDDDHGDDDDDQAADFDHGGYADAT